jgi:hypothetical protein
MNRDLVLPGSDPQGIGCGARLLRGAKYPGNRVVTSQESLENRPAEVTLTDDCDAHLFLPDSRLVNCDDISYILNWETRIIWTQAA